MRNSSSISLVVGSLALVGLTAFGLTCFEMITPGYVGVVTRIGTVQAKPMVEGLNLKMPWDRVEEWPIQVLKVSVDSTAGSADMQSVHVKISLNFRLIPAATPEIRRQLGASYEDTVLTPAIQETVKAVIAHHQAAQLLEKRQEVRHDMETLLQTKLNNVLADSILVTAFNIEDFAFESSFNHAIEQKQVAEQLAHQARNEVAKERAEADKKIEQARGRAESRKLEADANASALLTEAEARAKAIIVEADALKDNPAILKLRTIERWDGVMPRVVGTESGIILSLGDEKTGK